MKKQIIYNNGLRWVSFSELEDLLKQVRTRGNFPEPINTFIHPNYTIELVRDSQKICLAWTLSGTLNLERISDWKTKYQMKIFLQWILKGRGKLVFDKRRP
jgi:hypothetical protein